MFHIKSYLGDDVSIKIEHERHQLLLLYWFSVETEEEVGHLTVVPDIITLAITRRG